MNIEQLEQAGRLLYGDQWQSNLAKQLKVDSRRIRQWVNSERPISNWAAPEIYALLDKNQQDINQLLIRLNKDNAMSDFIQRLNFNTTVINKVGNNPQSTKSAQAVQALLDSIVIIVYKNNLFKIAGLDKDNKKLVEFTSFKDDDALEFWFGGDWRSKVTRIERSGDADELVKLSDIA